MNLIRKKLPQDLQQALEIRALIPRPDRESFQPPRWITSKREGFLWALEVERQDRPIFLIFGSIACIAMLAKFAWQGIGMVIGF